MVGVLRKDYASALKDIAIMKENFGGSRFWMIKVLEKKFFKKKKKNLKCMNYGEYIWVP